MTVPQLRLLNAIRSAGESAEYWPTVNDWVKDAGRTRSLALRNITRTVADTLVDARRRLRDVTVCDCAECQRLIQ